MNIGTFVKRTLRLFPLTPALSLRERGNKRQTHDPTLNQVRGSVCPYFTA